MPWPSCVISPSTSFPAQTWSGSSSTISPSAAGSTGKPDVDVVLNEIEFVGILGFVEILKDLIPFDGFSDPPFLEVTSEGLPPGSPWPYPAWRWGCSTSPTSRSVPTSGFRFSASRSPSGSTSARGNAHSPWRFSSSGAGAGSGCASHPTGWTSSSWGWRRERSSPSISAWPQDRSRRWSASTCGSRPTRDHWRAISGFGERSTSSG